MLVKMPDLLRRQLAATPPGSASKFFSAITPESRKRYAAYAARMVWFARAVSASMDSTALPLPWFPPDLQSHAGESLPNSENEMVAYVEKFFLLCFCVEINASAPDTDLFVYTFLMLSSLTEAMAFQGRWAASSTTVQF